MTDPLRILGRLDHYLDQLAHELTAEEREQYVRQAREAARELADVGRTLNRDSARQVLALMEHQFLDVPVTPSSTVGSHTREAWAGLLGRLIVRADVSPERMDRTMPTEGFLRAQQNYGPEAQKEARHHGIQKI
jgi:hypothetical protein